MSSSSMDPILIIGIDLGTSTETASYVRAKESFTQDHEGNLQQHREALGSISDVSNWPDCITGTTGDVCLPTDLIYDRKSRKLFFWGFNAQQYLDDPLNRIPRRKVFVVETIKLLLPDPDKAELPTAGSERYRIKRQVLVATLGKQPEEVFEDLMDLVLEHVLRSATQKYMNTLHKHKFELVLAFPSGWAAEVHTMVAKICSRSLQKAITLLDLRDVSFGLENVYTVSETICGIKEWMRETVAETSTSYEPRDMHLDELNEGDEFFGIDIGGGTGCLTPMKLLSKRPLAVEQLDRTQSLEVSGEAVHAEFERWLRPRITRKDYPGDIERLIHDICRKFRDEKRKCGASHRLGPNTWNFVVPHLKANSRKGYEKDAMRIDRRDLEKVFDPVIDILIEAIENTMRKFPSIKAILFLGQFGGSSAYLRNRMASHPVSSRVKIRHSQTGKLVVVKGAIRERLILEETFVREFRTLKSYGTLVTLVYDEDVEGIFPDPQTNGALPFEDTSDGPRLKVIEWAVPKKTAVQNGRAEGIGQDGRRFHTWPFAEDNLGFEDVIIVSDEDVPAPQLYGRSYTLWTESHQKNELYVYGQQKQVQQISFCWDLDMSQKIDPQGNVVPYEIDDLQTVYVPEKQVKKRRRRKFRELHYDLIWEITEMQVKVHVQPILPNQLGPRLYQLAKEQALGQDEKTLTGEWRAKALEKDIQIAQTKATNGENANENNKNGTRTAAAANKDAISDVVPYHHGKDSEEQPSTASGPAHVSGEKEPFDGHDLEQPDIGVPQNPDQNPLLPQAQRQNATVLQGEHLIPAKLSETTVALQPQGPADGIRRPPSTSQRLSLDDQQLPADMVSSRIDRRLREGCFTCKDRKKKCDCDFTFDETSGTQKCNTCLRVAIPCYISTPEWARVPEEKEVQQRQRQMLIKLGKRKARDESESSSILSSIDPVSRQIVEDNQSSPPPARRGTGMAVRGKQQRFGRTRP